MFLIRWLLAECPRLGAVPVPDDEQGQKRLLRSLFNVRLPSLAPQEFLRVQDEYLKEAAAAKGIADAAMLPYGRHGLCIWQGDITTLRCGAIVNAANSGMTGCYVPCHACIDNAIHTYAGVQLRCLMDSIMREQGHEEATGTAKITPAFNLPCRHILHTVGPIVCGPLTRLHEVQLKSCYASCLNLAWAHHVESIAFCCISTGEFHFPARRAAEIAVQTVLQWLQEHPGAIKVIFNVWKDSDNAIYHELLDALK